MDYETFITVSLNKHSNYFLIMSYGYKIFCTLSNFPMHFDEGVMFKDENAKSLKIEFAQRFLNVTRIIDCVTCEKCRLWGKLQVPVILKHFYH